VDQHGWPSLCDRGLNSRLRIFGEALAGRVAVNTDDLVQPSRQTRHSDLSYTSLAACTDV